MARRRRVGWAPSAYGRMYRLAVQCSGTAIAARSTARPPRPSRWPVVMRAPTLASQPPISAVITRASTGISLATLCQSCGLRTLEVRAKVSRAKSSRRLAPIRVALSSTCSSMARAARRLASSASCFAFSLSSSALAASLAGAASLGGGAPSLVFGVSSASRLTDAASLGVMSAIAACKATPSGSFSARRRCRSASVRLGLLSEASIEASAARVASRSRGCASCATARPDAAARTSAAARTRPRTGHRRLCKTQRNVMPKGGPLIRGGVKPPSHPNTAELRRQPEASPKPPFTFEPEKGCAGPGALLKEIA